MVVKFIWLIGVEGTGHHMYNAVLFSKLKKTNNFEHNDELHKLMKRYFKKDITLENREKLKNKIIDYLKSLDDHTIYHTASFPYGQPRDALRRHDLIEVINLLKKYCEIKYIVAYRDIYNTVYSGVRRKFTKSIVEQAKIIEDNYIFIQNQLQVINKKYYRIIDYNNFINKPILHIKFLADWLKLPYDLLNGQELIKSPRTKEDIPTKQRQFLEEYFTKQRQSQWKQLTKFIDFTE